MARVCLFLMLVALVGCQSRPGQGELYVYTDAQGNLVTLEGSQGGDSGNGDNNAGTPAAAVKEETLTDPVNEANYRSSQQVDAEQEQKQRDRFITYQDSTGQLVSKPLDMKAEKDAAASKGPRFETLGEQPFLDTYRALRKDCCQHLLEDATPVSKDQEVLVSLDESAPVLAGEQPLRAMALKLAPGVERLDIKAFIRRGGYLAAQLLWLDDDARPALLVDQPYQRRYPETWYRYGYLEGTLPREAGHSYLVVFLPYLTAKPATDGLTARLSGELVVTGQGADR